jgi:hypothetical protein
MNGPRQIGTERWLRTGRLARLLLILLPLGLAIPLAPLRSAGATSAFRPVAGWTAPASSHFASLPLSFEPNVGQADPRVRYLAHGAGYTLFLTDRGATLSLSSESTSSESTSRVARDPLAAALARAGASPLSTVTLGLFPVHATRHPRIVASGRLPGIVNYFIGRDRSRWHTDVPTFGSVVYRNVYPGIDLTFHGQGGRLEYDWTVWPRADARLIRMGVEGARSIRLERGGAVALRTALGAVRQQPPRIYQIVRGRRVAISGGFRPLSGGIGLHLGAYDTRRPLIVDPVLAYSTFFGTGADVTATGVAVDDANDAFITGDVNPNSQVPVKSPLQAAHQGGFDAFVAKINAGGTGLVYSTYIGGADSDQADGVAIDQAGAAYVVGETNSPDFPGGLGGAKAAIYVVKLGPNGDQLLYVHGDPDPSPTGSSFATGIAVDSVGFAFYTGTLSPGTLMFVRSLNPEGDPAGPSFTGVSDSFGEAIALDSQGFVYVAGGTQNQAFPTVNALNPTFGGNGDAVVMKLDRTLSPIWSTFLGGSGADFAKGMAVDPAGNVYVTGQTESANFPTAHAYQPLLRGKADGFVTELTGAGDNYVYSTYLGGVEKDFEETSAIAVDASGSAHVTGVTTAQDYPVVDPPPGTGTYAGGEDVSVTQLAPSGQSVVFSTLLGGGSADLPHDIALDDRDDVFIAGDTNSTTFPITTSAEDHSLTGVAVGFLAEISPQGTAPASTPTPTATSVPPSPTATRVPPPVLPKVTLASSRVDAGSKLKITVGTEPHASVTITLRVTQKGTVEFAVTKAGEADGGGTFTKSIKIAYHPAKKTKARVTVEVRTAGGSATTTVTVTILPHA